MLYTPHEKDKDIILEIKTLIVDEEDDLGEEIEKLLSRIATDGEILPEELDRALESDEANEIELCTEAVITTNAEGSIEIVYKENEDDPQIATLSKIIFRPESPNLLVMSKKGAINTVLSFEEGRMHICAYDTPYMPFKVYVSANKVDNRLLTDGKLKLDYVLNINDTPPQHFLITATVKEAPADILKDFLSK
ncbi:MAG: DUF1934 domain-containing protein [Clostridia bacterium]|nr:DUF1934 domain-containing protein [Clostridia bacterium]